MQLLHLEDSPYDGELVEALLLNTWPECKIRRVMTRDDFRAALDARDFDLILSDYTLPGFDGLSALAMARAEVPGAPFIFMSGTIGEDRAVEALRRGASDYIIKDRPGRLIPAVRAALTHIEEEKRRRRDEARLADHQARLREQASLLDSARDAICVIDLERRITYWNASAERLFGWPAREVVGQPLPTVLFGEDATRFETAYEHLSLAGEWSGDLSPRRRGGGTLVVESRWTLVGETEGRGRSILLINTDVTERRRMEVELLRNQRMESIGMLAGGVAHDLNNALTPILMGIGMLQHRGFTQEDRRVIENIDVSARQGAALVRQLLAFARGTEGHHLEVQVLPIIADLGKLMGQTLPRSINLHVETEADLWSICADATQFNQVLMNLCINARDALPQGGTITIGLRNVTLGPEQTPVSGEARPGPYLHVTVTDTGTGIPPEVLHKIFDPFFTTKPAGKGTGLGLSTVVGILKGHHGFVTVDSRIGQGTTFHLYWPALPGGVRPLFVDPGQAVLPDGRGRGVLVIDDDDTVRDTLALTLAEAGFRPFVAADGAAAIALFQRHRSEIQILVTDMLLPGLRGPRVIEALRVFAPGLPVLAISGSIGPGGGFGELASFAAPLATLAKPLTAPAFLTAVHRLLGAPV